MCNFLTNTDIAEQFAAEIELLSASLSPGGLLVAIGAVGGRYPAVYARLDTILAQTRLRRLDDSPTRSRPMSTNGSGISSAPRSAATSRSHPPSPPCPSQRHNTGCRRTSPTSTKTSDPPQFQVRA